MGIDPRADELIRAMRAEGHGFHVIARTLNDRGIPTRSGVGSWWPCSVRSAADPAGWAAYMRRYRRAR